MGHRTSFLPLASSSSSFSANIMKIRACGNSECGASLYHSVSLDALADVDLPSPSYALMM